MQNDEPNGDPIGGSHPQCLVVATQAEAGCTGELVTELQSGDCDPSAPAAPPARRSSVLREPRWGSLSVPRCGSLSVPRCGSISAPRSGSLSALASPFHACRGSDSATRRCSYQKGDRKCSTKNGEERVGSSKKGGPTNAMTNNLEDHYMQAVQPHCSCGVKQQ